MVKQKKTPKQKRELTRQRKIIRALYISVAVLVVAACGLGVAAFLRAKAAWDNPAGTLDAGTNEYGYNKDIVNLVLLGTDTSIERESRHMGVRTDTIVICAINMKEKTVRCITIPRDTYMVLNKLRNSNLNDIIGEEANRINAAYMLGINGHKGMDYQNTLDALGVLFGNRKIPFKYYAAINMDGIMPLADAVGGVPLTLDATITGVGRKGETVTLSGKKAEDYVRYRKDITDGSDYKRAQRQQAFFLGLARRIKEMGPLDAVPRLWGSLQQYAQTNMSMEEMLAFASILNDINVDDIQFTMPRGTTGWLDNMNLFFPDDKELQKMALDIWFNLPPGTDLWTSTPRPTPEKIISTPTNKFYTPLPTKKPTAAATPKATATSKPTEAPATATKPAETRSPAVTKSPIVTKSPNVTDTLTNTPTTT